MKANISPMSKPKLHLRTLLFATVAYIIMVHTIKTCHSFTPTSHRLVHHQATTTQRKSNVYPRSLFRELIMDDEEDLRADITVIKKTDGLDNFLKEDDRLCVIK